VPAQPRSRADQRADPWTSPGLVDKDAIELVSKLNSLKTAESENQISEGIYPSDVSEFTDYLKRNKITALRTLVRSVFSCPKVSLILT